ncbi:MAG: apolipoprotein N-acyltransferase, partial [Xanthobacteraceae bacterium]
MKFKQLINSIVLAWGWRRWAIACVAGALSALAMAPFNAWPVLFVTFPTLVWLIDGAGVGRFGGVAAAAATGWWFGFGYFVAGLYWMGYAFLVDAPTFGWLMPFAVIGLPAVLGIYTGLGVALARMVWTRAATRIFALAASLTITEWLRGHLFTGFPWNTFGYALTAPLPLAQIASVIGIWGLTFITILVASTPATFTDDRAETRRSWMPLALGIALLAALGGYGAMRLVRAPTRLVDGVHLR